MEEFIIDLVLIFLSFLFGLFGNKVTAKKLIKCRHKLRQKQEKKVEKEAKHLEKDLEILEEI